MEDVAHHGRTVLFVSHNMTAVRNLCQKGLVLKHGNVLQYSSIEDTVKFYLNEYSEVQKSLTYLPEEAPGNFEAKFLRAEIKPLEGNDWPISEGEGFTLEFEFLYLGKNETNLDITFHLIDEFRNVVFVGSTIFTEEQKYFSNGIIRASCEIPSNLMHNGTFTISRLLLVRNRGVVVYSVVNPISFELIPAQSELLGWMGKKEGIVKPKLNWSINHDSSN